MATKPTENKGAAEGGEDKSVAGPAENKAIKPGGREYQQRLQRGGHFDTRFPHPFGAQLPDLGEVPAKK